MNYLITTILLFLVSASSPLKAQERVSIYKENEPLIFYPGETLFDTALSHPPRLWYDNAGGVTQTIAFTSRLENKVFLRKPMLFFNLDPFVVFPGEKITVNLDSTERYVLTVEGNEQRNRELAFYKSLWEAKRKLPVDTSVTDSAGMLLSDEERLPLQQQRSDGASLRLFDSLATALAISDTVKRIYRYYLQWGRLRQEVQAGWENRSALKSAGKFEQIFKGLRDTINRITDPDLIAYGGRNAVSYVADAVLPLRLSTVKTKKEFETSFNAILQLFGGPARDFLLTRLFYMFVDKKLEIPGGFMARYKTVCKDTGLAGSLDAYLLEQQQSSATVAPYGTNGLYGFEAGKITRLEDVLATNRGKLVLLDFWATWCVPCVKEFPAEKELEKKFAGKNITFIHISFDREVISWREGVIRHGLDTTRGYAFTNVKKSTFVNRYRIREIPRFILIGKNGKVLQRNAPRPGDLALEKLIEKYL